MAGKRSGSRELVFTIDTGKESLDVKEFAQQVGAIARTLDAVKSRSRAKVHFQVVRITRNSPYRVVVKETRDPKAPEYSASGDLRGDLAALKKASPAKVGLAIRDEETRWDVIESMIDLLVSPQVRSVKVGKQVVGRDFIEKLKNAIQPDEQAVGSITGTLDAINLHGKTVFWIYPIIGPKKVKCVVPREAEEIRKKVAANVTQYVTVYGMLQYRTGAPFPFAVEEIADIELHDPDKAGSLMDLKGIAPNLTGDRTTEEYLRLSRNW